MLEHMRGLHADNPLAFEAVIGFLAVLIDDGTQGDAMDR